MPRPCAAHKSHPTRELLPVLLPCVPKCRAGSAGSSCRSQQQMKFSAPRRTPGSLVFQSPAHSTWRCKCALQAPILLFAVQQKCFFWMDASIWLGSLYSLLLCISGYYGRKCPAEQANLREGQFSVILWPTSMVTLSVEMIKHILCVEDFFFHLIKS